MKTTNLAIALAALAALALSAPRASAETPDKFVRYVEATGSQWVDTGIVGRPGIKTECKVEWMNLADTAFLASGYYSGNKRFYACWCSSTSGNMFTAQGTGDKVNNGQDLLFEKNRVYTYTTDFSAADGNNMSTNTVTIDGTKVFSKAYTALDTGVNLYVFANNQFGTAAAFSKTRCYGLKIWEGTTLVRDFRPCLKGTRAGLYDAVSGDIFYSGTSTDLTYDANGDVPDAFIDYVESFGNSYVDTGIIGRSGTGAKMELAWIGTSSDQALLDSRDGTNKRFYLAHRNTGDKWLWGYGTYGTFGSFTPGERYYLDASFAVGEQTMTIREGGPDGTIVDSYAATSDTTIDTGRSLYLFCCNQSGGTLAKQYWGKARVYSLQLFQDGEMVRDFRPCLKYGEAALYDDVSKTIFYPTGDPLGYDNSVAADRKSLVFVDYIESDGFTHLDTRVDAASPTRATGTFSWTQLRTLAQEKQYYCADYRSYLAAGCYNDASDANRFYMVTETSQKPWIGYGNNAKSFGSAMTAGTKYDFDVSFAAGAQAYSQTPEGGSATTSSTDWTGDADARGTLYLFAANDTKNGKPIYRSAARCYGLTIYQGGESPVRDFKPCVKDGQAALYDTVSGRVFYPVPAIPAEGNTGAVLPESANSEPEAFLEWVETDGTQFIDLGVVGRAGTTAEFVETSLCDNQNVEECFLGAVTADWQNERFYLWYHRTKFALGLGYGSEFWTPSLSNSTAKVSDWNPATNPDAYGLPTGTRTHARVSFAAGSQKVAVVNDATGARAIVSDRTIADDIDTGKNLYVFARNNNGTADSFAKSRLYWLRIWQDGLRVRRMQPVRLKNGLVALWDSVGKKAYLPSNSTGGFVTFSAVGPDSKELVTPPLVLVVR